MKRRPFLKQAKNTAQPQADIPDLYAPDGYEVPDWLRYARYVTLDGYTPPLFPHMKDFNARRVVDCVLALGGNAFRFQANGYWAHYPSKVYPPHPELGNRDLIDEVSRECRSAGIHLYCYTGYGHPFMEVGYVEQHPEYAEWVRRDPEGRPWGKNTHVGWPDRQPTCTLSDAYRIAIREVVKELCSHDIDGVYFDGPWRYLCFCNSCRRNFEEFTGMDIDRLRSEEDIAAHVAWERWRAHCTNEDLRDFRKIIHGGGKFMLGGFSHRIADGFMCEAFDETYARLAYGMKAASTIRPYRKLSLMYMGFYNVSGYYQPVHQEAGLVVHNTNLEDGDEMLMCGFTNLAAGGASIYAMANRLYYGIGNGSEEPAREVFDVMRRCEPVLKDSVPISFASIVTTTESLRFWPPNLRNWNWEMSQAFALAMLDSRISIDICPSIEMSEEWLASRRVIALCGASGISDEHAGRLANWVERGGALLATYDSGLYDEEGNLRKDGGALREVFGSDITGGALGGLPESYIRIQQTHPALADYPKGVIVMGDNRLLPVKVRDGATLLADCWNLGTDQSRGPAIIANQYGAGRVVYISGSLEANYVCSRVVSLRRMLASIIRYLGEESPQPFRLSAPTGVYGVLRRAANGDLVFWLLAPVGFKDASKGLMRQEYMPVMNVEVRIKIPRDCKVKSMRLVRAGRKAPFSISDGYAVTTIPTLHIAELVHVELC